MRPKKQASLQHRSIVYNARRSRAIQLAVGILILALSAQAAIHIGTVPITLQTIGLLIISLLYPIHIAATVPVFYLGLGALGFPIFARHSGGIHVLLGPTGGYLVGLVIGATIMVYLRTTFGERSFWVLLCYGCIGIGIVYICGVSWLAYLTNFSTALKVGFFTFLWIEPCKIVIVSSMIYRVKRYYNNC